MPWIAWLIAAVALGVAEAFTLTLAFGLLAAAALVAAMVAGIGGSLLAQVLAFAITAGVGLLSMRPIARRQMTHPTPVREGSYALIGKKGCRHRGGYRYAGTRQTGWGGVVGACAR